ncbi:manganese efflux pump [Aggregicoccus sp. 17bor-14]|uniref:manganese efflux pump MntP n=1 Tax=Myxococcaceae TaxID=31 RepID=UPI00129CE9BF|nr:MULTISPECIES: manganese efflux pump MntP family protein [Myxococcaceae]MBF5045333.1 manganese efflux pump [Simulacricoccus sp. 17bor-14]MRI91075.1 manganese efflux pump [Aggregicoccus sp. 17bor-14]
MLSLVLLSLGLSMDATAVAMTSGFTAPRVRLRDALVLALFFGVSQGVMPIIGWAAGSHFAASIEAWDHWVAFVLLGGIGAKMLWDAIREEGEEGGPAESTRADPFNLRLLILLALATSIDALVAGLTLPLLEVPPLLAAGFIGATTFLLSLAGVETGRRFGDKLGRKLDIVGGLVLIGLGLKTLLEHLSAR